MRRKSVLAATRAELEAAGKLDSALGSAALALAARLDDKDTAASAVAPTAKELRATLEAVTRHAKPAGDPVDEVKAKREERLRKQRAGA